MIHEAIKNTQRLSTLNINVNWSVQQGTECDWVYKETETGSCLPKIRKFHQI